MQFGNSAPSQTGIAHQLGIFWAPALAFRGTLWQFGAQLDLTALSQ